MLVEPAAGAIQLLTERRRYLTRRWFFRDCGVGLGAIALNGLFAGANETQKPHFAPKAKRVIYLFMGGAPSHLELFDNKPQLAKFNGTLYQLEPDVKEAPGALRVDESPLIPVSSAAHLAP